MESLQTKRAVVLQDTIQYYSQDPDGRRCKDDNVCCYSPKTVDKETSDGCAIGRLLSDKLKEYLDERYEGAGVSNDHLFLSLPEALQELGQTFLAKLQILHDSDEYWDTDGLTEDGKEFAQHIESVYCI